MSQKIADKAHYDDKFYANLKVKIDGHTHTQTKSPESK